jgi:hypothetical protein
LQSAEIPTCLWSKTVSYLGADRIRYSKVPPPGALHLLSGSFRFLGSELARYPDAPSIAVVHDLVRPLRCRAPRAIGSMRWELVRHVDFGGPTSYATLFGYLNLGDATPRCSDLRRTIGDYVDYGLATWGGKAVVDALEITELLSISRLDQVVRYPSHRSSTGYVFRALGPAELALIFGLPSWLRQGDVNIRDFHIVPVQILDGTLKHVIAASFRSDDALPKIQARVISARPESTSLPAISRTCLMLGSIRL